MNKIMKTSLCLQRSELNYSSGPFAPFLLAMLAAAESNAVKATVC